MATTLEQIPKDTWLDYFNEISRLYQGWATAIEILAGELGDQHAVDGLPFSGISYEAKGGSQAGDILIETGDANIPYETKLVHKPRAVRASPTRPGAELDIELDDREGITYVVQ